MIRWIRERPWKGRNDSESRHGRARDIPPFDVDLIMRYESLESDFRSLCAMMGLPDLTLPKFNAGPVTDYDRYYDEQLIEMVGDHYREDIETFGYEPPRLK